MTELVSCLRSEALRVVILPSRLRGRWLSAGANRSSLFHSVVHATGGLASHPRVGVTAEKCWPEKVLPPDWVGNLLFPCKLQIFPRMLFQKKSG